MPDKPSRRGVTPIRRTLNRSIFLFILLYTLLVIPWPGWVAAYDSAFRAVCSAVFPADDGRLELSFETAGKDSQNPTDTRIVIADKSLLHEDGSGPIRNLDFDAFDYWRTTAVFLALVAATPLPWHRRRWSLLMGLAVLHCLFFFSIRFLIWNEVGFLAPERLTAFRRAISAGLKDSAAAQLSLTFPALVWILVTFRRGDEWLVKSPAAAPANSLRAAGPRQARS